MKRLFSIKETKPICMIGATTLTAVAVFACAAMAWFTCHTESGLDAASFSISGQNLCIQYSMYKWDEDTKSGILTTDGTLNQYDCFITSKNVYDPIIVKVDVSIAKVDADDIPLDVVATSTGDYLTTSGGVDVIAPYVSNVLQFKFAASTSDFDTSSDDDLYLSACTYFDSVSAYSAFLVSESKTASVGISSLTVDQGTSLSMTYYIEIDYNPTLVNEYLEDTCAQSLEVLSGDAITFDSDVSTIEFSLGETT